MKDNLLISALQMCIIIEIEFADECKVTTDRTNNNHLENLTEDILGQNKDN